jgi:hypothetical protein
MPLIRHRGLRAPVGYCSPRRPAALALPTGEPSDQETDDHAYANAQMGENNSGAALRAGGGYAETREAAMASFA